MSIWIFVGIGGLVLAGIILFGMGIVQRVKELDEHIDDLERNVAHAAVNTAKAWEDIERLRIGLSMAEEKIAKLQEKLNELPAEELNEEYRRLNAWNDGVQSILSYGPNVPKLNKEAARE